MPEGLAGLPFGGDPPPSRYPFADDATLATEGGLSIAGMVLDARGHCIGAAAALGVESIAVAADAIVLSLSDGVTPGLCAATLDPAAAVPRRLPLADPRGRPAGLLVLDPAAAAMLKGWPPGTHRFAAGAATLCASCCTPRPEPGLRGVTVPGGAALAGEVWLLGAAGVTLSVDADANAIRVNAVGDVLYAQRECGPASGGAFTAPAPLRTINGIPPDASGGFLIVAALGPGQAETALRIDPVGEHGLRFSVAGADAG